MPYSGSALKKHRLLLAIAMLGLAGPAEASECGLSCCIAAGVEGVGSATGLTVTTQFDLMNMKTIRQGTGKISPTQAINNNLATRPAMSSYSVPTKMVMQKFGVSVAYRMDENNAFVLTVPYVINDMEMMMGMKTMAGMTYRPMTMATIQGLGDMSLVYMRDVYKDADIRTRQRFSLGIGVKAPTGKHTFRNSSGDLVHMMMQAGTGSWDGLLIANGTLGFGDHADGGAQWLLSPSLTYQTNTRNNLGYKVGDRLNYDLSARYRITSAFNVKVDMNGVWAAKDSSDGTIDGASPTRKVAYQSPTSSMIDNVANTGINSLFISPGFQWVLTPEIIISGEYRQPVYQKTGGIQQVTDNWYFMRASFRF
ncbi:hypothetical protein FEF65_10375 [Mariprofundus erugo]|uniref:Transporter n=1 Tax=Mariprofundus erugo TaxID=2528639 RepID=A0A5R9GIN3_9PROT|nr:hypothetical protein [Mariprofundus erugo]TLS66556.1 hypothetical protein FEF65_10375 [Mariprofundus erugo]